MDYIEAVEWWIIDTVGTFIKISSMLTVDNLPYNNYIMYIL